MRGSLPLAGVMALTVVASWPAAAAAQGFRGWVGTSVQAVELRPFEPPTGGCVPGVACYLPSDEELALVGTQDVTLTVWGLGVQGLSATTFLRGRTSFGSDAAWPRSDDRFDAVLAYAQLVRGPWTVRAGRQEIRSGLGFASFDGGFVAWRTTRLHLDAYGGRSLARGLREPVNEALRGVEDFVPDQSVWLWGGAAHARHRTVSATLRYQREILSDRSGLASERASLDASATFPRVRVTGSSDWDFGRGEPGKSHLTLTAPLRQGRWIASATARRYVPYFSLSTIWGFFEPVAYHEVQARLAWSHSTELGLWASGGRRSYGDTETATVLEPLSDTGWRAEAGTRWMFATSWTGSARYQLEWGPGGFLNSFDASVRRDLSPESGITGSLMSLQQIEQFRLGDSRAYGLGLSADFVVDERFSLAAGASVLRQATRSDGVESPWNQSRAWSTLRVLVGSDPGLARVRR